MKILLFSIGLAACGSRSDDQCSRAVEHVFAMTTDGPDAPKSDEQHVIDQIKSATLTQCQHEGLSQAQAECILAARPPDWDDHLRACPAYAAKPPSWIKLRPTRDERRAFRGRKPIADGPRESKVHFKQLVARSEGMCGLNDAGEVESWGEPSVQFPAGPFVQIAASRDMACGRTADGNVRCNFRESGRFDRTPTSAFSDFAIDGLRGCGVRISDQQIECWANTGEAPLASPDARFSSVTVGSTSACGTTVEGKQLCFGDNPPTGKRDGCAIDRDHRLACTTAWRMGPPPAGRFETVAVGQGFGCAVREGTGGTVCWGENDEGECNVVQ